MARWAPAPVVGGAYSDDTRPWSVQDTVNYIPVMAERGGTRSGDLLRGAPGMVAFASVGSGPFRGERNAEGALFVVSGQSLYRVNADGTSNELGQIPGTGRVSMAHNQVTDGNEIVVGNGQSGYVYNTATEAFTQITDEAFPGFKVCDYVDSYIAGVEPQGRFWFISDLANAKSYNSLDRQEAESQPDKIVTLIVSHREVFVMGQRTSEFFRNTGANTGTFQRIEGTEMDIGCAGTFARALLDNSVFWLGDDGIIYRLEGYNARRISTHPIEQAISRFDQSRCFATVYEDRGHKIAYFTFPDGLTFGYDVATGEWHRRKSYDLNRWRLNTLTQWNGGWYGGDYAGNKLYRLDWSVYDEDGEDLEARRITGVLHDNQNRVTVNGVELLFDVGGGSPIAGEHSVLIRYSKDGGHNWSRWKERSLGAVGDFQKRVVLRRMGQGRQWVLDIKITDNVKRDLLAASLQLESNEG
jgi:hypothetical protein